MTVCVLVTVVELLAGMAVVGTITVELRSVVVERSVLPDEQALSKPEAAIIVTAKRSRANFDEDPAVFSSFDIAIMLFLKSIF